MKKWPDQSYVQFMINIFAHLFSEFLFFQYINYIDSKRINLNYYGANVLGKERKKSVPNLPKEMH